MITKINVPGYCDDDPCQDITEYRGLSTDTKPTDCVYNGDVFFEMDTGDVFMYDAAGKTWLKI